LSLNWWFDHLSYTVFCLGICFNYVSAMAPYHPLIPGVYDQSL